MSWDDPERKPSHGFLSGNPLAVHSRTRGHFLSIAPARFEPPSLFNDHTPGHSTARANLFKVRVASQVASDGTRVVMAPLLFFVVERETKRKITIYMYIYIYIHVHVSRGGGGVLGQKDEPPIQTLVGKRHTPAHGGGGGG